jgi:hypothetical protein
MMFRIPARSEDDARNDVPHLSRFGHLALKTQLVAAAPLPVVEAPAPVKASPVVAKATRKAAPPVAAAAPSNFAHLIGADMSRWRRLIAAAAPAEAPKPVAPLAAAPGPRKIGTLPDGTSTSDLVASARRAAPELFGKG